MKPTRRRVAAKLRRGLLPPSNDQSVRRFWQQLDSIVPTPGSNA